jgi:hypothetical protein
MEQDEGVVRRMHRIFTNVVRMMGHRGYIVPATPVSLDDFVRDFDGGSDRDRMTLSLVHRDNRTRCIRVFFCPPPAPGKTTMGKAELERVLERGVDHVLLVLVGRTTLTPQAKRVVEDASDHIQCMSECELEYTDGGGGEWTTTLVAPAGVFPKVDVNDVIARYLGARPGDVLMRTRPSETAGFYTQYRRVCIVPLRF